jgi:outer membrane lipoprotein
MSKNKRMKSRNIYFVFAVAMLLFSCAPVIDRSLIKEGSREVSFKALRANPADYKGRLYVFGGVIVQTKLTAEGSQLEGMQVPVDGYGYFKDRGQSEGRFLAIMPSDRSMLDPEVFSKGRRVTLAGEFLELRKAKIEEMDYVYPVFLIRQIHLWEQERAYSPAYYYDPWFYPFPYYYSDPWWSFPYYYNYYPGGPPFYRRTPPSNQPPPSQPPEPQRPGRIAPQSSGETPGRDGERPGRR